MSNDFAAWCRAKRQAEELVYLDRDPKGYFEAVGLLDKLAKALGNK